MHLVARPGRQRAGRRGAGRGAGRPAQRAKPRRSRSPPTDVLMTLVRPAARVACSATSSPATPPTRPFGKARATPLPRGRHPCRDGLVEIATAPRWVPRMLATLDDPGLTGYFAAHPDAATRPETAEVMGPVLHAWLSARTRTECFEQATLATRLAGVYPVTQPGDLLNRPALRRPRLLRRVRSPGGRPPAAARRRRGGWATAGSRRAAPPPTSASTTRRSSTASWARTRARRPERRG